jgi:Zn-finger nucleic acid-binding protein
VFTLVTVAVRADLATARTAEVPVPYLTCPRCAATVYSAARWSSVDYCPRCGTELRDHDRLLKKAAAFKRALSELRHPPQTRDPEER